jgi:tetratricopeptide (TPR) repeat protein
MSKFLSLLLALSLSLPAWALDEAGTQRLKQVQTRWAQIQYQTDTAQKEKAFEQLAADSAAFTREQPQAAEAWIWHGIVTSSWAGAQGGLGALSKAKSARDSLEKSIQLDPAALQGSAYTSLGTLYAQVPGWPVGFGDEEKAEQLLQQALKLNPTGIDSLYFWGDYLYRQDKFAEARDALLKAKQAPARPGRELADQGRQGEIDRLLKAVEEELK